ncbi:amidophosphoribosyltransferase [Mannheimia sp. AT1]|uniref:Amidophosphoribosyltransferase n=1 Tax=Mannheimia cairinae TaxID=3025936 RepID=A0ABT5MMF6_9PAST|nr:amidophosphoribosyltransferase [Mannheimia cairinae]MDD0823365.1 amidophosphoribosyltransferase [Mannheimia cairinae]MDD0827027.1 amidophosphoribosyltransferase [Mannheimia cairinae]
MNIFGFRCFHCDKLLKINNHGFCSHCQKLINKQAYCQHCGMSSVESRLSCGYCLRNEPKWHRFIRIDEYKPPLSHWIHRFKFQHQYWLDQALARQLLLAIKQAQREQYLLLPQVIMPVPLFWQRNWQRGFNQAELIGRWLSKWLQIPLDSKSLIRNRATVSQRELTATERRRNLRKAFSYQPTEKYECVAIVDDVVTTGSTLNAICSELLKAGVKDIQVWALARA